MGDRMDRSVLRNISYGMYLIGSRDEKKVGCIANSIIQITSNPITIAVSINHENYTNQVIKKVKKFSVSILDEQVDSNIIGTFGYKTSKEIDKYKDIEIDILEEMPILKETCGAFVCKVVDMLETSTHTIFIGEIINTKAATQNHPMTYRYYHEVLKGKSPVKAPTYVEESLEEKLEEKKTKTVWKCEICGYEVEMDTLPEDYICPICGRPVQYFKKIEK